MPEPGFTAAETEAFDQGVKDGERIGPKPQCPYGDKACADAWENGYSVGTFNR